jgi:hypothetical protein
MMTKVHPSNKRKEMSANDDGTGPDEEYGIARLNDRGR